MRQFNKYIRLLFLCLLIQPLIAQHKTRYKIDENDVHNVASMKVVEMLDVGSNKILLIGDYSGKDNLGKNISPFYSIETDYEGNGGVSHYYKDANISAALGARAYGATYHTKSGLYVGGSSNVSQTVSRVNDAGDVIWTLNTGHHEIESLLFDTVLNHLVVLGQGESVTNIHDFYAAIIDTSGVLLKGYNYGNIGFEAPSTIVQTPTGYLAVGMTYNSPFKDILLISLDTGLNILWSKTYNRSSYIEHVINDAVKVGGKNEYAITGYVKGAGANPDSAFYFRIDEQGNPLQYKVFMTDVAMDIHANAITYHSDLKSYIIGGDYSPSGTNYTQPFVMKCDSNGNVIWMKDYGEGVDSTSESIENVLWLKDSSFFLASGNYLYQDGGGDYNWEVFMLKDEYTSITNQCNTTLNIMGFDRVMQIQQTGFAMREDYFFSSPYSLVSVETSVDAKKKECEIITSVYPMITNRNELSVYPNPASKKITIEGKENINVVTIFDMYGRVVLDKEYPVPSTVYFKEEIDVSFLESGIYLVVSKLKGGKNQRMNTLVITHLYN